MLNILFYQTKYLSDYNSTLVHCSLLEYSSQNITRADVIDVIFSLALNTHAATSLIVQDSQLLLWG